MIEITNKNRFVVSLMVKSKLTPNDFTILNIPGIGAGKNKYFLEDELKTEYIDRMEHDYGLISTRVVPDKQ